MYNILTKNLWPTLVHVYIGLLDQDQNLKTFFVNGRKRSTSFIHVYWK